MTLTETARMYKRVTKIGAIAIGVLIAIRVVFIVYDIVIRIPQTPPEQPIANPIYGKIQPLEIEQTPINFPANYEISLDLIASQMPNEPVVANIYPILKAPYGFLSSDRAKQLAATFNFTGDPIKLSATESLWNRLNETLRVNDQNLNYSYEYNYAADPSVFNVGAFSSQSRIQGLAEGFISRHMVTDEMIGDLNIEEQPAYLLEYKNQRLTPTNRIIDAAAARVDFWRKPVSFSLTNGSQYTIPFVAPHYVGALSNALMSGNTKSGKTTLLELNFVLWPYSNQQGGAYPLMTSQTAWEYIQFEPAKYTVYLGNLKLGPLDRTTSVPLVQSIRVKQVFLAYYDPEKEMDFIQPVWVFIGKGSIVEGGELDWVGYVPAVHPSYLISETPETQ